MTSTQEADRELPAEFVLVPLHPTNEMITAGAEHCLRISSRDDDEPSKDDKYAARGCAMAAYMDMIAARPKECAAAPSADEVLMRQAVEALSLSELYELSKVYARSYASPYHITFTVEGLRNLIATLRARLAGAAPSALPEAWGLYALMSDGWVLQHPVRFTAEQAEKDKAMYAPGSPLEVRPLYAAPAPETAP